MKELIKTLKEDYILKFQFLKTQLSEDDFLNLVYKLDDKYGILNINISEDIDDVEEITILNSDYEDMEEIIRISNEIKSVSWDDYIIKILQGSNEMLNNEISKVLEEIRKSIKI